MHDVLDTVWRILRVNRLVYAPVEREAGVSGAQVVLPHSLAEHPADWVNELAAHADRSSANVLMRRLVNRGLIRRRSAP